VLPDWLPTYWLKVISQPWEGDVTMVLPSTYWQIRKAITNPSKDDLQAAVREVRRVVPGRRTWEALSSRSHRNAKWPRVHCHPVS
jgi:hypothetical protein